MVVCFLCEVNIPSIIKICLEAGFSSIYLWGSALSAKLSHLPLPGKDRPCTQAGKTSAGWEYKAPPLAEWAKKEPRLTHAEKGSVNLLSLDNTASLNTVFTPESPKVSLKLLKISRHSRQTLWHGQREVEKTFPPS